MGNVFENWFVFKSKAQREREKAAYMSLIFPFGERQQVWEKDMLTQLFPKKKRSWSEFDYAVLVLRENMKKMKRSQSDPTFAESSFSSVESCIGAWSRDQLVKSLKRDEKDIIISLAELEEAAESFEALPTCDEIFANVKDNQL